MIRSLLRFLASLFFAVIALVLTAGLVLYFKRDWQRSLIEASIEARTSLQWQFEEAYFEKPHRLRASSIFALKGSEGVEAAELELEINWARSWTGDFVAVSGGRIHALRLDLSNISPAALGLSEEALRSAVPPERQSRQAVGYLIDAALRRLAVEGANAEIENLEIDGSVFLPFARELRFALTLRHARTSRPEDAQFQVHLAEFR